MKWNKWNEIIIIIIIIRFVKRQNVKRLPWRWNEMKWSEMKWNVAAVLWEDWRHRLGRSRASFAAADSRGRCLSSSWAGALAYQHSSVVHNVCVVKMWNFDVRPHDGGGGQIFHGEDNVIWYLSVWSIACGCRSPIVAVVYVFAA